MTNTDTITFSVVGVMAIAILGFGYFILSKNDIPLSDTGKNVQSLQNFKSFYNKDRKYLQDPDYSGKIAGFMARKKTRGRKHTKNKTKTR